MRHESEARAEARQAQAVTHRYGRPPVLMFSFGGKLCVAKFGVIGRRAFKNLFPIVAPELTRMWRAVCAIAAAHVVGWTIQVASPA